MSERDFLRLIDAIAGELVVDSSLVEKDWYAMQLIKTLASGQSPDFQLVFSGGTSLSKGFGLIQRFSEDLDFKVCALKPNLKRADRRNYREQLLETIRVDAHGWQIEESKMQSGDGSKYFKVPIQYKPHYPIAAGLRPYLQLEVTFEPPRRPPERRPLESFVSQARGADPEVSAMPCVVPVETAADKLSALSWRVIVRERDAKNDDPSLIRHLHDLAALTPIIKKDPEFPTLARHALRQDRERGNREIIGRLSLQKRLQKMLHILTTDTLYATEYERFVLGMSYAAEDERISFSTALDSLHGITTDILKSPDLSSEEE